MILPNRRFTRLFCGFEGIVPALDAFAASHGVAPPTEYETYDDSMPPARARVRP